MYHCNNCGGEFENPEKITETHGLLNPPYETIFICPYCNSNALNEKIQTHCRCCGAKLRNQNSEYCSDACRNKGEKLWKKQLERINSEHQSPINRIIRELTYFNNENNTNYSYGQYVSMLEAKRRKKKCAKKKSNT